MKATIIVKDNHEVEESINKWLKNSWVVVYMVNITNAEGDPCVVITYED